jgi:uncharacterized membrane protein YkoI
MKVFTAIFMILCCLYLSSTAANAKGYYQKSSKADVKIHNAKQAARLVKKRFGGKILKVKKQKTNGHRGYKVKLLKKNGHVVSLFIDALTGKILGAK